MSFIRIDDHGIIKVADFGLTEEVYASNYFKQLKDNTATVKLPVKWMALESLHDGLFSEKSDVVSAVSVIASLCQSGRLLDLSESVHTHTVVLWCVELGGVQSWQSSLSWPRPSRCSGAIRYWRETAVSTQWSLLTGNVIISAIKNLLLYPL